MKKQTPSIKELWKWSCGAKNQENIYINNVLLRFIQLCFKRFSEKMELHDIADVIDVKNSD